MSTLHDTTLGKYLDDVASAAPTPGGGSVAVVVAALGARTCLDLLAVLELPATLASRHCVSDVGAAAHLALAAMRASLLNVHINITFMKDSDAAAEFDAAAVQLENDGQVRNQRIADQVIACIRG